MFVMLVLVLVLVEGGSDPGAIEQRKRPVPSTCSSMDPPPPPDLE